MEERVELMTDFQFKALIEMIKDVVKEHRDPDKIIARLEQIQKGDFGEKSEPGKSLPKN